MKFRNRNHQAIFNTMKNKLDHTDKAKMSVLYLLTSDVRLWSVAKHHVFNGHTPKRLIIIWTIFKKITLTKKIENF